MAKTPVFITDPVVAAHYKVPVGSFVELDQAEATYNLTRKHAFSVFGPNIAPAWGRAHPQAPAFVPYAPTREGDENGDDCDPAPTTRSRKAAR